MRSAYLLECMEFFLGGMGSWMCLIIGWRESCLCLLVEPLCLPGQPCCFQLQQLAHWDSNSWGDSRWGDSWLRGFTLGRGLPGTVLETGHVASRILTSVGGGIAAITSGSMSKSESSGLSCMSLAGHSREMEAGMMSSMEKGVMLVLLKMPTL